MPRKLTHEEAAARMVANNLKPLELYPGASVAWKCSCMICGTLCSSRLMHVMQKGHACPGCGMRRVSEKNRKPSAEAEAMMRAAQLEPLEPYPGALSHWLCRCLRCGNTVSPRVSHVQRGGSGCRTCGQKSGKLAQLGDPDRAAEIMREAGLDPMVTYPGDKTPWKSACIRCGKTVTPRLYNVRRGTRCRYCAKSGFKPALPALVYVLVHSELRTVKIGITGVGSTRIARFVAGGWQCFKVLNFDTGTDAEKVEYKVLQHIRDTMGLTYHLSPEFMGASKGCTETFCSDDLPVDFLWGLVQKYAQPAESPLE